MCSHKEVQHLCSFSGLRHPKGSAWTRSFSVLHSGEEICVISIRRVAGDSHPGLMAGLIDTGSNRDGEEAVPI